MRWFTTTRLSPHQELTPEGFLLCRDIAIARCGTQHYRDVEVPDIIADANGWVAVDREPHEVFREDSIGSFIGKPITDDHPEEMVTPENYTELAVGHIQNIRRGSDLNHDCLIADLLFTTKRGIDLVRRGKRALSVGYDAVYVQDAPGRARQCNIVANHLALVSEGRCGPRCTILDGAPHYSGDADFVEAEHPREPESGKFTEGGGGEAAGGTEAPIHTMEGAQALIDRLSAQYPMAAKDGRVEVRPDDIGGDHAIGQHRGGHVYLTPKYWNKEFLDKHNKEFEGIVNDASTEGIVTHEFGHLLHHKIDQLVDPVTVANIIYKHLGHDGGNLEIGNDQTSPYGQENVFEFVAEAFTAFHNGKLGGVGPDHPFYEKSMRTQTGLWQELLATAAGKRLPATPDAARYISTMYNMETNYSTERLEAARALLEGSTKRGDGKLRARLDKELKARAKGGGNKLIEDDFVEAEHPRDPVGKFSTAPGGKAGITAETHLGNAAQSYRKALAKERASEVGSPAHFAAHRQAGNAAGHLEAARDAHEQIESYDHTPAQITTKLDWQDRAKVDRMMAESKELEDTDQSKSWALHFIAASLKRADMGPNQIVAQVKDGNGNPVAAGHVELYPHANVASLTKLGSLQRGAGSKVLQKLIDQVKQHGAIDKIDLQASPLAVPLYERFGFRTIKPETADTWATMELDLRQPAAAPAPAKLPPGSRSRETREKYAAAKALAERIEGFKRLPNGGLSALNNWIPMEDLKSAINTLWDTRGREGGKPFDKTDQKLMDTLTQEVQRRFKADHQEREKRADSYAYMSDDDIYDATKLNFGGDSRMKPGMKRQLGLLPPSHIARLQRNGVTVHAVQEIPRLSSDHPYAPNMQPAGLFTPNEAKIEVADQITLPDGTKRQIWSREKTLRHEIGHAIDQITGLGDDPEIIAATNAAIDKMTPEERHAAAYYIGETARDDSDKARTRRSESFAELYAYAFNDGSDADNEGGSFGGMGMDRRYDLFGKVRAIVRKKVADSMGDRMIDRQWRRAA